MNKINKWLTKIEHKIKTIEGKIYEKKHKK